MLAISKLDDEKKETDIQNNELRKYRKGENTVL